MDTEPTPPATETLKLLSIVLPARDEEGCIEATVRHLNLELKLQGVPHEIIVVDDGSKDRTWEILTRLTSEVPELHPGLILQEQDRESQLLR